MAEAARKLDMPFSTFKRRAEELGLYKPNQGLVGIKKRGGIAPAPLNEIFEGKHPKTKTVRLKKRLLAEGLLKNKCSACGVPDSWNRKPLVLELDHINGNSKDHRLENLRILCPNCQSQTSTFRNKKR